MEKSEGSKEEFEIETKADLRLKLLKFALKIIEPFQDTLDRSYKAKRLFHIVYNIFTPDKWVLVETEGIRMYINPRGRAISRFIIQKGGYEKGTVKIFKELLKRKRRPLTFFDIGAHWGYYSLIASSFGEDVKVFAFEPEQFNYQMLLKAIHVNGFTNIVPINKAVSDKTGLAKLFVSTSNVGGHSIVPYTGTNKCIQVETIALDDFCCRNNVFPNIIKIDVEGAELMVLKGMENLIKSSIELDLLIEFTRNQDQLLKFLDKYFKLYRITKNGDLIPLEKAEAIKNVTFEPNLYCSRDESC